MSHLKIFVFVCIKITRILYKKFLRKLVIKAANFKLRAPYNYVDMNEMAGLRLAIELYSVP